MRGPMDVTPPALGLVRVRMSPTRYSAPSDTKSKPVTTPPVVVNQQHGAAGGGYVHVGYNQQGQPIYAPANSMPHQHQLRK